MDDLLLMQGMSDSQRLMFQSEVNKVRKNRTTALLLTLFLGGFGVHRFYLGDLKGLFYILFIWTLIPAIIALIELFLIMKRVDLYNEQFSQEIASKVKLIH